VRDARNPDHIKEAIMINGEFLESIQVVSVIEPVDITSGANSGDWVHLGGTPGFRRCLFLFAKAAGGTAGEDPTITLQEATAADGTGAQNLVKIARVYSKEAATNLTTTGQFTLSTQTAAATYTTATLAENACLVGFEVKDVDLSDGFEYVTCNIADPGAGNAQIGCVLAVLFNGRYLPEVAPSAIA
jgi:hypothetical protein